MAAPDPPDLVTLEAHAASSPWPTLLRDAWTPSSPTLACERVAALPTIAVARGTYEEWLAARTQHFRKRMRRGRRLIEEEGGSFSLGDASSHAADVEAFARLHAERWASNPASGVTPAVVRMLADSDPRRLRVWRLLDGDDVVAVEILLSAGGATSFWLGAWDEGRAAWQPSIQTMLRAVEHAFEAGDRTLDLGEGDQDYKRRFADGTAQLAWSVLVPRGPRAAAALAAVAAGRARRGLGRRLPSRVRRALRRSSAS